MLTQDYFYNITELLKTFLLLSLALDSAAFQGDSHMFRLDHSVTC